MMRSIQLFAVLSVLLVMANAGYAGDPIDPHGKPANAKAGKVEHYDL